MFTTPFAFMAAPAGGYDADAQAFFDRVTAAGGSLTTTEKNAANTLVLNLKGYSLWTLMKVIYPMLGSSAAACAQNLKSASFTGTFSSGWTFASTGITSNGTTAFMDSGFNNQGDWTSTSNASMGFISRTNQVGVVCDMGAGNIGDAANSATIYSRFSGDQFYSNMNSTSALPGSSNTSSVGFFVASRISALAFTRHKRGSSTIDLSVTDAIGTNPNATIYLGAGNNAGTATSFAAKEYDFAFIGDGLTQAQVDDYWTALQTFNTALSR